MKGWLLLIPLGLAACMADKGGPNAGQGRVNLSVSGQRSMFATTTTSVVQAAESTLLIAAPDTVIVRSVDLVVRRIKLKPVETAACEGDDSEGDQHATAGDNGTAESDAEGCEEIKAGPVFVSLPLGTTAINALVNVSAPAGQYDKLEFKIHAPKLPKDSTFLKANPGFAGVSIQVTGTFSHAGTRTQFTYTTALEAGEEVGIDPPIVVDASGTANVTLRFDLSTWFAGPGGIGLVDPATGNSGGANEQLIQENIKSSINAFEDDNHDGHDDHNGEHHSDGDQGDG